MTLKLFNLRKEINAHQNWSVFVSPHQTGQSLRGPASSINCCRQYSSKKFCLRHQRLHRHVRIRDTFSCKLLTQGLKCGITCILELTQTDQQCTRLDVESPLLFPSVASRPCSLRKHCFQQECIPVGCLPSAVVAVCPGGCLPKAVPAQGCVSAWGVCVCPGGVSAQGVSAQGGGCLAGGVHAWRGCTPPPVDRRTHTKT